MNSYHGYEKREGYHRGYHKPREEYQKQPFKKDYEHRERVLQPQPLGDRCNPLCPFFICNKAALFTLNKPFRGKYMRVAYCRLTGGECIGSECQYSGCKINALLPDGRCAKALEKKTRHVSDEELFRELQSIEDYDVSDFAR